MKFIHAFKICGRNIQEQESQKKGFSIHQILPEIPQPYWQLPTPNSGLLVLFAKYRDTARQLRSSTDWVLGSPHNLDAQKTGQKQEVLPPRKGMDNGCRREGDLYPEHYPLPGGEGELVNRSASHDGVLDISGSLQW